MCVQWCLYTVGLANTSGLDKSINLHGILIFVYFCHSVCIHCITDHYPGRAWAATGIVVGCLFVTHEFAHLAATALCLQHG